MQQLVSKYKDKTSAPIIIVFNFTRSPDSDIYGILRSVKGGTVDNIVMNDRAEIVDRYKTYERDSLFLKSEVAKRLSAVICYNSENTYQDIRFNGDIIINDSATTKLDEESILELKNILFKT
jgi:hypothetical protein